ncbi:MAG: hypothetical protein [Caudoviricetes sp.]|nr:MAG: hypothetical protein [Caudoviricetes sp.]
MKEFKMTQMSKRILINEGTNKFGAKIKFEKILPGWVPAGSSTRNIETELLSVSWTFPHEGHSVTYGQQYVMTDYEKAEKRFNDVLYVE